MDLFTQQSIRSPGAETPNEVQILYQRVENLENALSTHHKVVNTTYESLNTNPLPSAREGILNFEDSQPSVTLSENASKCTGSTTIYAEDQIDLSTYQLGSNWYFDGIPIFTEAGRQWLSNRTVQDVKWADLLSPLKESFTNPDTQYITSQQNFDLPNRDTVQEILSLFFRSSFRLTFPVLDECLFQATVEDAYRTTDETPNPTPKIESRACILAALSIATRLKDPKETIFFMDGDECAAKAHYLLNHLTENISLEKLQTILLLVSQYTSHEIFPSSNIKTYCSVKQMHYMFQGRWNRASLLNSMASVTICSLKGHYYKQPTPGATNANLQRNNSQIRILFWLTYMLDKDLAIRSGDPPLLTESYCDLTISIELFDYYNYLPRLDDTYGCTGQRVEHLAPHFTGDVGLSLLKEKVCYQLFSAHASKCSDDQLLLRIRKLDDEIESWRMSLPSIFRPALFVSHNNTSLDSSEEAVPLFTRRMSLQLEYHHLMTVIHTTVRRCAPSSPGDAEDLHAVVHSSFDLSLMASRSTLLCLKLLLDKIGGQAFRYVLSSTSPLFFSTSLIGENQCD